MMLSPRWALQSALLVGVLALGAAVDVRELRGVQDAIMLNKKEEVSVVLLFDEARDGAAVGAFASAAMSFEKGVAFGRSSEPEVWKRYGKRARAGPVVLLFRDFDKESGKKKRGRKEPLELPLYSADSAVAAPGARAIAEFVLAEALPDVVPLPEMGRAGVDAAARSQSAMALPLLPRLILFHEGSSKLEALLAAAGAKLRRQALCVSVDLTDSDADSGAATLKRAGLEPEDVGDDGVLVRVTADWGASAKLKQAGLPDAEALVNFALAIGDDSEEPAKGGDAAAAAPPSKAGSGGGTAAAAVALTDGNFDATVLQGGDDVWVVLFTSARSEDARAFEATWEALRAGLNRMRVGVVNIDTDEGRSLAVRLNVLEGGIPAVLLYLDADAAAAAAPIMPGGGGVLPLKKLRRALKAAVKGLKMSEAGKFLKRGVDGLDPAQVLKKARRAPAKVAAAGGGAKSKAKKETSTQAPATNYYLIAEIHPGYFWDVQKTNVPKAVAAYRELAAATKPKTWTLVTPMLRRQSAHSQESYELGAVYDPEALRTAFPDVAFASVKEYFAVFGETADTNLFFMYDAENKNKGECPEDSTNGESERFKQGYMIFKPKADVSGPADNQVMWANKKINLGRHACVNVVGGEEKNERLHACGEGFVKTVLAALEAKEGARSVMLNNFHNIEDCRSSDEAKHPKAATDPWALVPTIAAEAEKFLEKELGGGDARFLALHLKRDDDYRDKHAELYFSEDALVERMVALAKEHGTTKIFLATTEKNEVIYLRKKFERELKDEDGNCAEDFPDCHSAKLVAYKRRPSTGFKGLQVGFVEQILASKAQAFVGAKHSQFTRRIHELREERKNHKSDCVLDDGAELLPWDKY